MTDAARAVPSTADDVAVALMSRWPVDRHVHLREACLDPTLMGQKIDVLVVGCWRSLRYELDAFEIKVSYSDWRREIEREFWTVDGDVDTAGELRRHYDRQFATAAARFVATSPPFSPLSPGPRPATVRHTEPCLHKSEPFRRIAHRFWIAAPAKLADRIQAELPVGWGLLGVDGRGCRVQVQPQTGEPPPLAWSQVVGLLRGAGAASTRVRDREYQRGYDAAVARLSHQG